MTEPKQRPMTDQWHWIITLMRPAPGGPIIETLHGVIDVDQTSTRQGAYEKILESSMARLDIQGSVAITFFSLEPNALGASMEEA